MEQYTAASTLLDYNHERVQEFIHQHTHADMTDQEKAIALYMAVRDGWRYTASLIYFELAQWKSSSIIQRPEGHCLDKAILLTTCLLYTSPSPRDRTRSRMPSSA